MEIGSGSYYLQSGFSAIWRTALSGGNYQTCKVTSFDSDGFTVTWTKTGSPTGTATVTYTAIR
jgi:hypothetical protein